MVQPHKVFYKGAENDFIVFVEDADALKKYRDSDSTIPLVEVVSVYKVFTNRQGGAEGVIDEASKSELQNEFGTKSVDEVLSKIIKEGADKSTSSIHRGHDAHNDSMGSATIGH